MDVTYNPFDPLEVDHHQPVLDRLRHEAPVSEIMPGVFYVARHDDIIEICRDTDTFKQGRFRPMDTDTRTEDELNLGETDPPSHTRVRKILQSALSPPAVRRYEPYVLQVCRDLVDRFADRGSAELIAELGGPLPGAVIGYLAGIPVEYRDGLRQYSDDYIASGGAETDPILAQEATARVEAFDEAFRQVIRDRQRATDRPRDLLSSLIESVDDDGHPLSEDKILTHLSKDVVVGGIETTTHLVGNLFYDMLSTPGAYGRVRADRSLIPAAVEESLRQRGPVQILFRVPNRDTEVRGVQIPAGSIVALGYASANHDEAVFTCPYDYRLDRGETARKHLGFGWGIHLCVGAPLARLEMASALVAVTERIPSLRLAPGFDYDRVRFFMMQGPTHVDVVFDRHQVEARP
jgi:cytochrome P450